MSVRQKAALMEYETAVPVKRPYRVLQWAMASERAWQNLHVWCKCRGRRTVPGTAESRQMRRPARFVVYAVTVPKGAPLLPPRVYPTLGPVPW